MSKTFLINKIIITLIFTYIIQFAAVFAFAKSSAQNNVTTRVTLQTVYNTQFLCRNGESIEKLQACDGIKTCSDGSDETEHACSKLYCPKFLYRCAYGACVIESARCNGKKDCVDGSDERDCSGSVTSTEPTRVTPKPVTPRPVTPKPVTARPVTPTPDTSTPITLSPAFTPAPVVGDGCILPMHLSTGKYSYTDTTYPDPYVENGYADIFTSMTFNCNQGYKLSGTPFFYCYNKTWLPDLNTASCTRLCNSLLPTDSYNTHCYLNNQKVSCENPVEGTTVKIQCRPFYVFHGTRINPLCRNGKWDNYPGPCEPVCGQKKINPDRLVIGGSDATQGEYPWMLAVYNTSMEQKKHICGASLISRFFAVSAAHCFADSTGTAYPKEYFTIVAGKYKRDLNILEDSMQVREIRRLIVHEDYKGNFHKYRDDIAVIEVDRFELTFQVQPVCIDWDNTYEDLDFIENNIGVVAGWGLTQEGSQPAEVLKKLLVPYRSKDICKMYMDPEFFQQYYTSDKICAGFKDNGTSVCNGDSGGGLYFRSPYVIFYVRGIVSLTRRANAQCDSNHYALYTKVSKYLPWIESVTRRLV